MYEESKERKRSSVRPDGSKVVTLEQAAEYHVACLLWYAGEDPGRPGLKETPKRYVKALEEYTSGYSLDPVEVLKTFEDGAEKSDQMVIVKDIPFYSLCEHHMAPFFGTVDIGYIPSGKIVGLSKLARLTEIYARRFQVQERLSNQIADAIFEVLGCLGVGVRIQARHLCMEARGVRCQGANTMTTALRGAMLNEAAARDEFLNAVRK